jgi:hypothetical protein
MNAKNVVRSCVNRQRAGEPAGARVRRGKDRARSDLS